MKKLLLALSSAVLTSASVCAVEPAVYPGEAFTSISSNGQWAVSDASTGVVTVFDLVSGQKTVYKSAVDWDDPNFNWDDPNIDFSISYGTGNGRVISDDGVLIGCQTYNMDMSYLKDGKWTLLTSEKTGELNSITPDGSRICGAIEPAGGADMDGMMRVPVIFDRKDDGGYGDPIYLPYPEKDLTGRTPQYVTALCISDDGKLVFGQQVDYRGIIVLPILYKQDDNGMWTYSILQPELFKVEGFTWPEYPGDGVPYPQVEAYMGADSKAAFEQACEDWELSGDDYSTYPNAEDYLTPEEKAAYEQGKSDYEAWEAAFIAYDETYFEFADKVPQFGFNNGYMSGDGRYVVATNMVTVNDPMSWSRATVNTPYVFDLVSGTYKAYQNDKNLQVSDVAGDGTVLATTPLSGDTPAQGYILPAGAESFETLYNYYSSLYPGMSKWMEENMTHEYEVYQANPETGDWDIVQKKDLIVGIPHCSADLSVISTFAQNVWDFDSDPYYDVYGYLFTPALAGVKEVSMAAVAVKSLGHGVVAVEGDASSIEIYDMSGRLVYSSHAVGESVSTGLGAGLYMVVVKDTEGASKIEKLGL